MGGLALAVLGFGADGVRHLSITHFTSACQQALETRISFCKCVAEKYSQSAALDIVLSEHVHEKTLCMRRASK